MSDDRARTEFLAGLRDLAGWLEANPQIPVSATGRNLLCVSLRTSAAVEAFAEGLGRAASVDDEGNATVTFTFGPIAYQVYGYSDFDEHLARMDEQRARSWAASRGLVLTPQSDEAA
jgi:hypothetical protein